MSYTLQIQDAPAELREGLQRVRDLFPLQGGTPIEFIPGQDGVVVSPAGVTIHYRRRVDAFRALGGLLSDGPRSVVGAPRFDMLGVMLDVSRNGVLRPDVLETMLVRFALCGIDTVMLYTEDTYEVPHQPFFGYLRGGYTHQEIVSLDGVADAVGIEMFPCIQTLGHLQEVLQWPVYEALADVPGVLLAGDPRVHALLRDMIHAASAPYRSHRIHVGLDETFRLGEGRYRQLHGPRPAVDIFLQHLDEVRGICRQLGLQPMMWSDIYFHGEDAYDPSVVVSPQTAASIPTDVGLVFWDYYHTEPGPYRTWLERHRALGHEPIMASGIWTWNRLWASLPYSTTAIDACMTTCKSIGIRQAIVTLWGDDGQECDTISAMPALVRFATHGYADTVDDAQVRRRFETLWGQSMGACVMAAEIDTIPHAEDPHHWTRNTGKALLWQDPLLPLLDGQLDVTMLARRYTDLADRLEGHAANIARVLSLKLDLRTNLVTAYRTGDRARLQVIVEGQGRALQAALKALWLSHEERWMALFKPFGWEVLEGRYGGLLARLATLERRVLAHVDDGRPVPELEVALEVVFDVIPDIDYARAKTPSAIK